MSRVVNVPPGSGDEEVAAYINKTISKMGEYGRTEFQKPKAKQGYVIFFCNDSKDWGMDYYSMHKGSWHTKIAEKKGNLSIDADEILVVGVPKRQLRRVVDSGILDICPTYYGSYEARSRGEIDLSKCGIPPALKAIQVETGLHGGLDSGTHKLLEDKFRLN